MFTQKHSLAKTVIGRVKTSADCRYAAPICEACVHQKHRARQSEEKKAHVVETTQNLKARKNPENSYIW